MTTAERPTGAGEMSWEDATRLLEKLPTLSPNRRIDAIEKLVRVTSPGIRERALRLGASLLPEERLAEHVHNDADATLRNAGLEMLKLRGPRSFPLALRLLADADQDVVLQAVLILDHLRDPRALEPLRGVLAATDLNIVQAAILAIGRLGNARSVPYLLPFLDSDPWLQMAAVQALGDLRSPRAVPALARLFPDLLLGSFAVEAVARIGGPAAYRALAAHWLRQSAQFDAESVLGMLAHVLEGLNRAPSGRQALVRGLARHLADPKQEGRAAAARCILALGPSAADEPALSLLVALAEGNTGDDAVRTDSVNAAGIEATSLPASLARRPDLIPALLRRAGTRRTWGFFLAATFPRRLPRREFVAALADAGQSPEALAAATRCLLRMSPAQSTATLGKTLLGLYLRLPPELRSELNPALKRHRVSFSRALATQPDVGAVDRVVLAAQLGSKPTAVAREIVALGPDDRRAALAQLASHRQVMQALPWAAWLREAPETYGAAAAEAISASQLADLLPLLRDLRPRDVQAPVLRACAELRDRAAVSLVLAVLAERADLRPLALETLGRIGGPEARRALSQAASSGAESRLAYRALAMCATEEDEALFRGATSHEDWYVRLACADVLGRFARPENLGALARLAGDPVPAVAHRALAALEG
ncbi:MAG: HEAT repeat domain-containing protein [Acidobacteriota bacterium]